MKPAFWILLLLSLSLILSGCSDNPTSSDMDEDPEPPEMMDPTILTLDNSGAQAYQVIAIEGEAASADLNENNVPITLMQGERFTFINEAGASNHPLDFRNEAGEKLLGQSNGAGMFDENEEVDLVKHGNTMSFTLTEELAEVLADYVCSFHPGMRGDIQIME